MTKKFELNKLLDLVKTGKFEEAQTLITETENKNVLRIFYEIGSESPRTWDNLGMLYIPTKSHWCQYDTHDELGSVEIGYALESDQYLKLPIFRTNYGEVKYSTKPIVNHLDDDCIGFILTSRERIEANGLSDRRDEEILDYLSSEVETYSQWANGDVYSFDLEDGFENVIDSCGGFYRLEDIADHINPESLGFSTNEELINHIKTIEIENY